VLDLLRKIAARPAIETADPAGDIGGVPLRDCSWGRAVNDPASIVVGTLAPLVKGKQPAVTSIEEARAILETVGRLEARRDRARGPQR
jgi:hypothetical protein